MVNKAVGEKSEMHLMPAKLWSNLNIAKNWKNILFTFENGPVTNYTEEEVSVFALWQMI